jgi:1,4-dihydroxy-2-naphthoyl-CoA synthase
VTAIVEAAVASVQAKEVLLLGVVCPPVQSEFLSIVASLVPYSSELKDRSTRWVSSLLTKPGTATFLLHASLACCA